LAAAVTFSETLISQGNPDSKIKHQKNEKIPRTQEHSSSKCIVTQISKETQPFP